MAEIGGMKMLDAKAASELAGNAQSLEKVGALSKRKMDTPADIEKAAAGFESLLVNEMLKSMWSTVDTTGLLGEDSNASQIYRGMFNQAVADNISEGQGLGIKDFLKKELFRMQQASKL